MDQIQPLVVHVDQLTPENMLQLSQAGYRHTSDPKLLIFVRSVPTQDQQQPQQQDSSSSGDIDAENLDTSPTPIQGRNSKRPPR